MKHGGFGTGVGRELSASTPQLFFQTDTWSQPVGTYSDTTQLETTLLANEELYDMNKHNKDPVASATGFSVMPWFLSESL